MDQVLEQRPAPEAIPAVEATSDSVNDGSKIFTEAGGAGALDKRAGAIDPHRVVIHNGRLHTGEFLLERHGFRFVRHDTKVTDFFDEAEVRRAYYAGNGKAGESRKRRFACSWCSITRCAPATMPCASS